MKLSKCPFGDFKLLQLEMLIFLSSYMLETVSEVAKLKEPYEYLLPVRILRENVSPKELVRRGVCLLKLRIEEQKTGLYGRTLLKFQPYWDGKELPAHNFTSGDIAGLSLSQADGNQEILASGIVSRVSQSAVSVAFDESHESLDTDDTAQFKLIKLANDVTYKRLKQALQKLNSYRSGPASHLINVLFHVSEPSPPLSWERDGKQAPPEIEFFNTQLDDSQREAVRFALYQRELAIIHGPPGTGKTTTVVEIILQAIKQKLKILTCAPSNIAVDNLVERVANYGKKIVRLGHPARLLPTIQKYALDAILASSEESKLVEDVRKDMDKALSKMKKTRDRGEKQQLREDMKFLRKELRHREQDATRGILNRADIVMATLTGATDDGPIKWLDKEHFDLVIIDECSQALEAACWIALLKGPKCVIAGDHNQLPPTILSHKAAKEGLELTLMERQLKQYGDTVMRMLTVQYRMNEVIMKWSSDQLYNRRLTAHESVSKHLLRDIDGIEDNEDTSIPMLLVDTAGCYLSELHLPDEVSKGNEGEADIVSHHVNKLINSGLPADKIAVIAPYNLQVDFLRLRLSQKYPSLEIKSVDGFQGREKEAVIISMVRSNEKGEVGFLAEDRRINVAITRARRHLAVVCDSETVSHHAFLKVLIDYMMEHGEVRSAQQYIDEGAISKEYQRPDYVDQQFQNAKIQKTDTKEKGKSERRTQTADRSSKKEKKKEKQPHTQTLKSPVEKSEHKDNDVEISEETEREYLQKVITEFMADSSTQQHEFPLTLSSRERFLVHELAETFGLLHISEGEGKNRHITVKKQPNRTCKTIKEIEGTQIEETAQSCKDNEKIMQTAEPSTSGSGKSKKSKGKIQNTVETQNITSESKLSLQEGACSMSICDICGKDIPESNLALHQLRCKIPKPVDDSLNKDRQPSGKSKKKKKSKVVKSEKEEEEDFDTLIQEAIQQNNVCNFGKCKNYTTTVGQICPFCKQRFCLSHHIPEVHGCGAQAKSHARAVINKEGVLFRGSGVPDKKIDPNKRAHLQRKLDQKLNNMADTRKIKKKDKE